MDFLNNIFVHLYEKLFNYDTYNNLLNCVFNNKDYGKMGFVIIIISIILLTVFYKFWDPINNPKLKLALTCLVIGLFSFLGTHSIFEMNNCLKDIIINYSGVGPDPYDFMFQIDLLSALYGVVISFVLAILPFRLISTNNRYNPF